MAGVACTHPTRKPFRMEQGGGVLCSRVVRTSSRFGGSKGMVDICRSRTYIYHVVGNPQLGFNRFESSLLLGYGD
jgi:hypothetical protein